MRRLFILFSPLPPLVTVGVDCHVLQFDPAPRYPHPPPHYAPTIPKTVRHVTFSCRRELGQSLWSQQVLSVHSGPARLGVGDAPRDQSRVSYLGFNRGSVINLTTGQVKKKEKNKVKKKKKKKGGLVGVGRRRLRLSVSLSSSVVTQSIFIWLCSSLFRLCGCRNIRMQRVQRQNSNGFILKQSQCQGHFSFFFFKSSSSSSFKVGLKSSRLSKNPIRRPTLLYLLSKCTNAAENE